MLYRLLGPFAVERAGRPVDLGGPKQRALAAALAQEAGVTVSTDRLLQCIWGDDQPPSAVSSLHALVSRVRSALRAEPGEPAAVVRSGNGYSLDVPASALDTTRFVEAARAARSSVQRGDWAGAVRQAESALSWWRGSYLEDLADEDWVRPSSAAWSERRAGVLEDLVTGLLGVGELATAVARTGTMLAEQPLGERAAWLHMTALHRAGRSGDALAAYRSHAAALDDELGLEPGPELKGLQTAILRQDPAVAGWPASASPPIRPEQTSEVRAVETGERLVGRTAELAVVDEVLHLARGQRSAWLVLMGKAGIGKTRLATEAAAHWRAEGGSVVQVACPDDDAPPPWWPVRQVLRALGADPGPVLAPEASVDADTARFDALERVRDVVVAELARGPLLLLVDDAHWADPASLRLLSLLAETVDVAGLAVVLTARDGVDAQPLARVLAAVARRPGSRHLVLPPLGAGDVEALASQVSGRSLSAADAGQLVSLTGGNPFLVREYARGGTSDEAPAAVRSVLRRRLDALPAALLEVVRVVAVLGDPLDVRTVAAVLGRDELEVAGDLDDAADRDVLAPALAGGGYTFAHALLREEAAADVPGLRRERMHLAAAEALASSSLADDVVRRAAHLRAAGQLADPPTTFAAAHAAALATEAQWDPDAAATWWRVAVEALDASVGTDARQRDGLVAAELAALSRAGRGQDVLDVLDRELVVALRAGLPGSAGRLAANLMRASGSWPWPAYGSDPAPLMTTLRGLEPLLARDPAARSRVLAVTAIGSCYDLDPAVPDGLSARALELARSTGDPDVVADALLGRALTFSGVASHAEESIALLEELGSLGHALAPLDEVIRHNVLTMACMNLGRVDEAEHHVAAGVLGSDLLRLPVNRVQLRWAEACTAQWRGDLDRAEQLYAAAERAHRATELQQSGTFELAQLVLAWERGRVGTLVGRVPTNPVVEAWVAPVVAAAADRPGADRALEAEVRRPEPDVWTSHGRLTLLAHAVADRGLLHLVPELRTRLEPLAGELATIGQIGTPGPVSLALARLARLAGEREAATAYLAAALETARRLRGATSELRCRLLALEWAVGDGIPAAREREELEELAPSAAARGMHGLAERADELLARR
ncbi:BTAD domain-containing putative transcriptional regulator [Motilibacter peucedani]|nr:BTAD domain-containing putative transcriptional regulator [Motilibacter peucedani]